MAENETKLCFNDAVSKLCQSWDVLQHAVEANFGGIHSKEKAEWLETVIAQFFVDNENLEPWEVENYISEIMDNEFDLIIQDNSLINLSKNLCQCYAWSKFGDKENRMVEFIKTLNSRTIRPMQIQLENNEEHDSSDEEDDSEPMQVDPKVVPDSKRSQNLNGLTSKNEPDVQNNELDNGWTVVSSHKKKK